MSFVLIAGRFVIVSVCAGVAVAVELVATGAMPVAVGLFVVVVVGGVVGTGIGVAVGLLWLL